MVRKKPFFYTLFLQARGDTPDGQKKAILLHTAGMDVQDIFDTIPDVDTKNYAASLAALDEQFAPQMNESYERHVFRSMSQDDSETVDQFITRLRQQAKNCGFQANQVDENVRDRDPWMQKLEAKSQTTREDRTDIENNCRYSKSS
jgi:hypothetical protein